MPRLKTYRVHLRPDPDEDELRETARAAGFALRINGLARKSGEPHLELYEMRRNDPPVIVFRRSSAGLAWLEFRAALAQTPPLVAEKQGLNY